MEFNKPLFEAPKLFTLDGQELTEEYLLAEAAQPLTNGCFNGSGTNNGCFKGVC